ncbi:MAG: hypothetical protein U0M15_05880 [Bacillota bacterium]|nr:hypothetical protein [Bacillota bacterium]
MKKLISLFFTIILLLGLSIPTAALELSSDTALLMDAQTGQILYQSNGYETVPSGTFGKIVSALTALENGDPDDIVTVNKSALQHLTAPVIHLVDGETISLEDLLYAELLANANDAAYVVADHFTTDEEDAKYGEFIKMMAKELDYCLASTMTMDNVDGAISTEQMCSCVDLANMIRHGIKNDDFRSILTADTHTIAATNLTKEERNLTSQHKMVNGAITYRGAKGGFVSINDIGEYRSVTYGERRLGEENPKERRELIAVVLHSDSEESMYQDIEKLLDYGFKLKKVTVSGDDLLHYLPDTISSRDITFEEGITLLLPEGSEVKDLEHYVSVDECGYFRGTLIFYQSDSMEVARASFFEKNEKNLILPWVKRIGLILAAIATLVLLFIVVRSVSAKRSKKSKQSKVRQKPTPPKQQGNSLDFGDEYENNPEYREYRRRQQQEYLKRRYAETGDYKYSKAWLDQQKKIATNPRTSKRSSGNPGKRSRKNK